MKKPVAPQSFVFPAATDHTPEELAETGSHQSLGRLLDRGRDKVKLARTDLAALSTRGWNQARLDNLAAGLDALDAQHGAREGASTAARESGLPAGAAHGSLARWIEDYEYVVRAPRSIAAVAPKPPHEWRAATQIEKVVEPLAKFVADHAAKLAARGGTAAFAQEGRDLAKAFAQKRAQHLSDLGGASPEVFAQHVLEGAIYLELEDLSAAAHRCLARPRAALYALDDLRADVHARAKAPSASAAK